jgi:hypothetical protein
MATLSGTFPFLKTLFADSRYQGAEFAKVLVAGLPYGRYTKKYYTERRDAK